LAITTGDRGGAMEYSGSGLTPEDCWKIATACNGKFIGRLTTNDLLEMDWEIMEKWRDINGVPGIYLLRSDTEVVYVGQSSDIGRRLKQGHHVYNEDLHCVYFLRIDRTDYRTAVEKVIIQVAKPKKNKRSGTVATYAYEDERATLRMPL
jgi:predicted GIY-YIG superfamily endonuclease